MLWMKVQSFLNTWNHLALYQRISLLHKSAGHCFLFSAACKVVKQAMHHPEDYYNCYGLRELLKACLFCWRAWTFICFIGPSSLLHKEHVGLSGHCFSGHYANYKANHEAFPKQKEKVLHQLSIVLHQSVIPATVFIHLCPNYCDYKVGADLTSMF